MTSRSPAPSTPAVEADGATPAVLDSVGGAVVGERTVRGSRGALGVLASRASWNLADQLVSSGTNMLLSFVLARSLSAEGFGAFAIAFTIYSFLIGASRALVSQPLVVRYVAIGGVPFRSAAAAATGATVILGMTAGAVTALSGFLIEGAVGTSLLCIAVMLPGLLLQDMWRMVFFAEGRPSAAFWNDIVWGLVQFGAVAVLLTVGQGNAPAMLLAWGGAACVAAVVGVRQFGVRPSPRASIGWLGRQRDLLGYYAAGFFCIMGVGQVTMLLIAAIGEPADVGALRAAAVVLGPLNIAGYSLSAFALPELSRRQLSGRAALTAALALSALMVLGDIVYGIALLLMPEWLGPALLGDTWATAEAALPATLLGLVAIGVGFGAHTLMVARGFAKESFWTSSLLAPGFLIFGLVGLEMGGAPGAALGMSLAQCVVAPVVWWRIIVLMRREAVVTR